MAKSVIPFSNGTEGMCWYDLNCLACKTKCHYKRNIEFGFVSGEITFKTAEFIGFEFYDEKNVKLNNVCNNKDKFIKKSQKNKGTNYPTLF